MGQSTSQGIGLLCIIVIGMRQFLWDLENLGPFSTERDGH